MPSFPEVWTKSFGPPGLYQVKGSFQIAGGAHQILFAGDFSSRTKALPYLLFHEPGFNNVDLPRVPQNVGKTATGQFKTDAANTDFYMDCDLIPNRKRFDLLWIDTLSLYET